MDRPRPPSRSLIVHAGAWDIPPTEQAAHRAGCEAGAAAGWAELAAGKSALDAVVAAVRTMEADRNLNAGAGSVLCQAGHVEMDAGLMCGTTLQAGGVAALRCVAHPIEAALAVLNSPYVLLVGDDALPFLRAAGVRECDPASLVEERERRRLAEVLRARRPGSGDEFSSRHPGETVGCVAIDHRGRMAAGASTGGTVGKPPGRLGDSAIPGAGYYADDLCGAAVCTGWGEPILRAGLARRAVELTRSHNAVDAAWLAMGDFEKRFGGKGGVIVVSRDGTLGYAFNTPKMPFAYQDETLGTPHHGGL